MNFNEIFEILNNINIFKCFNIDIIKKKITAFE